jgi:predicted ATPase/DNA-binding XRE family transcriptional regulator
VLQCGRSDLPLAHYGGHWYAASVAKGEAPSKASRGDTPFGTRLRQLREAAGLTQGELAGRAGLTAKAIGMLERGARKHPYPHTVRALADSLELSEDERVALTRSIPRRSGNAPAPVVEAAAMHPSALPVTLTPLVGREREVEEIVDLLGRVAAVRLLTLTGPGGIGKTRLAIEAARKTSGYFPDGVAFVALAPLGDAALMMPSVSQALGLREAASARLLEVLRQYLRDRRFLLVLDNFEHVTEAAPEVVDLLGSCPKLSVLATSRAPLRVRGEHEYPVSPLAVPDPTRMPEAQEVAQTPAVKLFIERAEDASSTFELTHANAPAVAAICWRLDGLPLALELAAAQTRFLGPTALLSRLDQALQAGGARDLPERQRTMRATLDWSYELLHEPERELFECLSVFAGGFTLEATESVGGTQESGGEDVLALLGNLVEQSLVVAEPAAEGDEIRYRMLEPIRQYAWGRLEEGGKAGQLRLGHARYYLALAEAAEPHIKGHEQVKWLDRLEAENDNLRAAIRRSLEAGDVHTAARFGWALGMYWVMRTRHSEGRMLLEKTLTSGGDLPAPLRARALWALGVCVYGSGDDERLMEIAEEGIALSRRAGDSQGEAYALGLLGYAALQLGNLDRAARTLEESLEMVREQGDAWRAAHILNHMTVVALNRGEHQRAAGYAEESLALVRQTGDRYAANVALSLLAQMAWASDEHERAAGHWRKALRLSSELANKANSASSIQGLATVATSRGELRRAARLLGAAEALLEAAGLVFYAYTTYTSNEPHQRAGSAACEELGERAWKAARDEGRSMSFEQAVEYALGETSASVSPFV